MGLIAAVVGASGLVGGEMVAALCADPRFDQVHVMVRRTLPDAVFNNNPKLKQHVLDFSQLGTYEWPACDALFCCLGTTIKTAGSRAAFRAIDLDLVVESAVAAKRAGASRLMVVSSMGADPKSSMFYSQVKGEMESAVAALAYSSVAIFRPSFLEGERTETRLGEHAALLLLRLLNPLLPKKYRSISARAVAGAMLAAATNPSPGVTTIESDQLQAYQSKPKLS